MSTHLHFRISATYQVLIVVIHDPLLHSIFLLAEVIENGVVFTTECPLFGGLCAQIVHSPPKLTYKRHIIGMSTSPRNDSFCHTSCTLVTSTPSRILLPWAVFWACKPDAEIRKFLMGVHSWTPIHVSCFKHGQNWYRISFQKATLYWCQKKARRLTEPLGRKTIRPIPNRLATIKTL